MPFLSAFLLSSCSCSTIHSFLKATLSFIKNLEQNYSCGTLQKYNPENCILGPSFVLLFAYWSTFWLSDTYFCIGSGSLSSLALTCWRYVNLHVWMCHFSWEGCLKNRQCRDFELFHQWNIQERTFTVLCPIFWQSFFMTFTMSIISYNPFFSLKFKNID